MFYFDFPMSYGRERERKQTSFHLEKLSSRNHNSYSIEIICTYFISAETRNANDFQTQCDHIATARTSLVGAKTQEKVWTSPRRIKPLCVTTIINCG